VRRGEQRLSRQAVRVGGEGEGRVKVRIRVSVKGSG